MNSRSLPWSKLLQILPSRVRRLRSIRQTQLQSNNSLIRASASGHCSGVVGGERTVVREIRLLETRMRRAAAIDVGELLDCAGEEPATERRISDKADAELARELARLFGLGAIEQRVFGLHCGDGVHLVGT